MLRPKVGELWEFRPRAVAGGCTGEVWEVISESDTSNNAICRRESRTCAELKYTHKLGIGGLVTINHPSCFGDWHLYESPFAAWARKVRKKAGKKVEQSSL